MQLQENPIHMFVLNSVVAGILIRVKNVWCPDVNQQLKQIKPYLYGSIQILLTFSITRTQLEIKIAFIFQISRMRRIFIILSLIVCHSLSTLSHNLRAYGYPLCVIGINTNVKFVIIKRKYVTVFEHNICMQRFRYSVLS